MEVLGAVNDEWLARTRAVIVEPHDRFRPGCTAAIHAAAQRHGFRLAYRGEYTYLVRPPDA